MAAAFGLSVQPPLAWVDARQGVNVVLAVLVLVTALGIDPGDIGRAAGAWRPLAAVTLLGVTVLPALAWAVSRLVAAGPLREGVAAVGVAPCEIASVATTALAGGLAALSAAVLVTSTLATVGVAGPILLLESGAVAVQPGRVAWTLSLVVVLPFAAGLALRAVLRPPPGAKRAADRAAVGAVAVLVALIAAEVHLSGRYLGVAGALVIFVAGSAGLGRLVALRLQPAVATAVVLTTSMRDFAVAASLATAAYGPAASAPLGIYGVLVLVWGTAAAGLGRTT